MELNQNLLRDFAQITDSKGEEVNGYKEGIVAKVEGGEYHVLLSERYAGEFKGYMAFTGSFVSSYNRFDRYLIMNNVAPKDANYNYYHYVEKNGSYSWELVGKYTPLNNDIWARLDMNRNLADFTRYIVYEDPTVDKTIYETESITDFTVASTYVDCTVGDKVVVQLKNNRAVIISNMSTLLTNKREMDAAKRRISNIESILRNHQWM